MVVIVRPLVTNIVVGAAVEVIDVVPEREARDAVEATECVD